MSSPAAFTKQFTSSDCPVNFGTNAPSGAPLVDFARWIQVVGAGSVVVVNETSGVAGSAGAAGVVIQVAA